MKFNIVNNRKKCHYLENAYSPDNDGVRNGLKN